MHLLDERAPTVGDDAREEQADGVDVVPEISASVGDADAEVATPTAGQYLAREWDEAGMPQPEDQAGGEEGFPRIVCDDELVQEGEEYSGIIVGFDVLSGMSD